MTVSAQATVYKRSGFINIDAIANKNRLFDLDPDRLVLRTWPRARGQQHCFLGKLCELLRGQCPIASEQLDVAAVGLVLPGFHANPGNCIGISAEKLDKCSNDKYIREDCVTYFGLAESLSNAHASFIVSIKVFRPSGSANWVANLNGMQV